jgi:hypothetical protein
MPKRPKPPADRPESRHPMSPAEIATAAFGLAILRAHDDASGGVLAGDAAVFEMLSLLALESLAMIAGRDPAGFESLLAGLGIYARARSVECMRAALAGQPPSPLGQVVTPPSVH